jgi:serine/threonine protein kinase
MTSVADGTGATALEAEAGPESAIDTGAGVGAGGASLRGHAGRLAAQATAAMAMSTRGVVMTQRCYSRAVETPENRVGDVLASKYRLEELLGSGGMGHVYRAVNESVGRAVAIKLLRREHAQNPQVVDRFLREARAANLVRHPNVVDVLDIGKEDDGTPFIVQELLVGEDLAHFVARSGGKLPVEDVCDLLLPVIDAVAEAHAHGVVHRDIKPENVFLAKSPRGRVPKLLDFGISKVRAPDLQATEVGMMMGTPAYMAPEQVQGARDADARSDVWGLGIMMFELIAGRMPFDSPDPATLFIAIATKDAPTLLDVKADVVPAISRVVERCLRRRPDERYPSAAELGRDLRHVMEGSELEATGKRSIPPAALAAARWRAEVPELVVPRAPAVPSIDALPSVDPRGATAMASSFASTASAPPSGTPTSEAPARARLAADSAMSGVGLAPGPSTMARAAGTHAAWGVRPPRQDATDMTPVVGMAVVGLVAILGAGLLMQLAHRTEGWPLARFAFTPSPTVALGIHGAMGLAAVAGGLTYAWRGVRHWRGDLAGGPPSALFNALIAAIAFFAAIELVSAVL